MYVLRSVNSNEVPKNIILDIMLLPAPKKTKFNLALKRQYLKFSSPGSWNS